MKKRDLLFPRMVWMFSLFLTLLPFDVKAGEMRPLIQYTAVFSASNNPRVADGTLAKDFSTAIYAQHASDFPHTSDKRDLLTLLAGSERTKAVIGASMDKCLRDDSQPITPEAHVQRELASRPFAGADGIGPFRSASDASSAPLRFHLARRPLRVHARPDGPPSPPLMSENTTLAPVSPRSLRGPEPSRRDRTYLRH